MAKITVQHDGKPIEVDLPAGLLTDADVQSRFIPRDVHAGEVEKVTKAARDNAIAELRKSGSLRDPKELLEDKDFRTQALTAWGVDKKVGAEEIERLRTEFLDKEVKPLQDKLKGSETVIQRLLRHRLVSELVQTGTGVVKDIYLKPVREGADPVLVKLFEDVLKYDPETDGYYAFDPVKKQFVVSTKGTRERPYVGVKELFESWAGDKANTDYLLDERQRGAGVHADGGGGSGGGSKDVLLTKTEASDHPTYQKALDRATKQGGTVVVQ